MEQNKTGKYLKYAIGEIVLVVIGILIALSINNWHTHRLQIKKEVNYIKEIKSNLQEDSVAVESVLVFNKLKSNTIDSLFQLFDVETDPRNYLPKVVQYMDVLTSYEMFSPLRIAFDNMISSDNIDLISNKKLRKELSFYYSTDYEDGTQERVKEMTRTFGDGIVPMIFNKQLFKNMLNYNSQLQDITNVTIHENEEVYSNLFTMKKNIDVQNELVNESKKNIHQLLMQIENILIEN